MSDPDPPPRSCSARLGYGSWCYKPDGHDGAHEGAAPYYGPIEARPELWRGRQGMTKK